MPSGSDRPTTSSTARTEDTDILNVTPPRSGPRNHGLPSGRGPAPGNPPHTLPDSHPNTTSDQHMRSHQARHMATQSVTHQHQRPNTQHSDTGTTRSSQQLSAAELSSLAPDDARRHQPAVANLESYMRPFGNNAPEQNSNRNIYQTRNDEHVNLEDWESTHTGPPQYEDTPDYASDRPPYSPPRAPSNPNPNRNRPTTAHSSDSRPRTGVAPNPEAFLANPTHGRVPHNTGQPHRSQAVAPGVGAISTQRPPRHGPVTTNEQADYPPPPGGSSSRTTG